MDENNLSDTISVDQEQNSKDTIDTTNKLLEKCGPFFEAMGDTVRQNLFMNMAAAGGGGVNVSKLTSKTDLSRPAISHHLKVLKDCGLIESYREGTKNYYYVDLRKKLDELKSFVAAVEHLLAVEGAPIK
jgi:ArsR family transcriptional regulator, arsenate/arsenite/antimonite-responsive transcriptional repressor